MSYLIYATENIIFEIYPILVILIFGFFIKYSFENKIKSDVKYFLNMIYLNLIFIFILLRLELFTKYIIMYACLILVPVVGYYYLNKFKIYFNEKLFLIGFLIFLIDIILNLVINVLNFEVELLILTRSLSLLFGVIILYFVTIIFLMDYDKNRKKEIRSKVYEKHKKLF